MSKILTIIGATGTQGSSVLNRILEDPSTWHIRAVTRNPSSAAAKALHAKGVELAEADLADLTSLKAAFAGSHAIFASTDFFGPFGNLNGDAEKAKQIEWIQTENIIQAALACDTLQHFIFSTLPHASRISKGKFRPAHFDAKNRGEDLIRSYPELLARTTFAYVGWYASNFLYPTFTPTWLETAGKLIQIAPSPADTPLYTIGDPVANIGPFVAAMLEQPQLVQQGRCVHVAIGPTSMGELLQAWSKVTGKPAQYVETTVESYDSLWPAWGEVEGVMLQFYSAVRGLPWLQDGEKMVFAEDLGLDVGSMVGVEDALRKLEL